MNKTIKIATTVALFLCASFLNINELKAQNNPPQQSTIQGSGIGTIVFLNTGLNTGLNSVANTSLSSGSNQNPNQNSGQNSSLTSGLIQDDITGEIYEFHYAGLEVLEINEKYIYILQITASGKIIIRDIHHSN